MQRELERSTKSFKDLTTQHKISQRLTEEQLMRKTKEVEALAKEKKCKGCYVCLEELREKP